MIWSIGALLGVAIPAAFASKLVSEQVETYRKILGTDKITLDGVRQLIKLHDDEAVCNDACERHVTNLIGKDGLEWSLFCNLVDKIYGDMISDDPYQPQEVHLAITDNLEEMKVIWATMSNLGEPFVEYTLASNEWTEASTIKLTATNYTYTVEQKWWPIFEGVLYEVNMAGLEPRTDYKYRVGGYDSANAIRRSKDFPFHSAPVTTEPNQKTVFATLADQGTFMLLGFAAQKKLTDMQDELGVDIVMYAGDLCYAGLSSDMPHLNITSEDEFEHIWDLWGIQNEAVAATRPFMVGVGNHERFYDWAAVTNRYKMPYEKSGGNGDFWFSYDYGNVHWVSINSEDSFDAGSEQMTFLENDLIKAVENRANVPWIIVSLHRPVYCSDESQYDSHSPGGKFQVALEPLMTKYDVDLVLTGHMHAYERVHPVLNGDVTVYPVDYIAEEKSVPMYKVTNGEGPVYIVQGNTGAMQVERWIHPKPEWSAVRFANGYIPKDLSMDRADPAVEGLILESNYTDTFGFGVATFMNSTHLHYENIAVSGEIGVDEFWIVKRV